MSKQTTLQRVSDDIGRGYLGTARDRLHGLLGIYPDDLSLRSRLAEVYWQLRHPGLAGLYWFLDPERNDDIRTAIAEFERECGGDPWILLTRLKLRWNPDEMPDGFAKEQIRELLDQCRKKYKRVPEFPTGRGPGQRKRKPNQFKDAIAALGCGLVVFVVLFLLVMGVIQVVIWFK
ncbi:MAG: hypothetical protein A2W31_16160 [Planctomycetes bacterium RBG_16_64_10]|nr:MAG: hypothetical protein A2W31_16160 [Planctomycetes bacterium RBG_16_64_10]